MIRFKVIDAEGNIGKLERSVSVATGEHFLLAVADGMVGDVAVRLDEVTDQTRVDFGDAPVFLHGRAALYYKGRIDGDKLFSEYFITAHGDSAKDRETGEFFARVIDPRRTYAIFGDSSNVVSDANARGKLYVHVQADESEATVGAFKTALRSYELLRYDRVVDGARVKLDKA